MAMTKHSLWLIPEDDDGWKEAIIFKAAPTIAKFQALKYPHPVTDPLFIKINGKIDELIDYINHNGVANQWDAEMLHHMMDEVYRLMKQASNKLRAKAKLEYSRTLNRPQYLKNLKAIADVEQEFE